MNAVLVLLVLIIDSVMAGGQLSSAYVVAPSGGSYAGSSYAGSSYAESSYGGGSYSSAEATVDIEEWADTVDIVDMVVDIVEWAATVVDINRMLYVVVACVVDSKVALEKNVRRMDRFYALISR
uniref:Uncharacterized protein n=1 Tax=Haemonchus contortus TaxID=6289 RepID=A0A912M2S3_HAECO